MNNRNNQWIHYLTPPVIGVCLYIMIYIQSFFERMYFSYWSLVIFPLIMYTLWGIGRWSNIWLEQHYSWQKNLWKRFSVQFLLFLMLAVGITVPVYIALKSWVIYKKIEIDTISMYHLTFVVTSTVFAVVVIFAAQLSLHFIQQWVNSRVETEKFKKESLQAQFEGLKHQISPHFLFNSMNILSELVDQDTSIAKQYINKLSEVYRYVLQSRQKELVLLSEELEFAESYVFLLQKRFGENLKAKFHIDEYCLNQHVPPLTLQLLIENAVKHNVVSNKKPLIITVQNIGFDKLMVANNLQRRIDNVHSSTQIGLVNLKTRYQYLADQEPVITKTETKFQVEIPLLEVIERVPQMI